MLTTLRTRLDRDEDGFTLIELMVVVLIIAILIAIAIPTFLGAQDKAKDRGTQSDLRNALTTAKVLATDNGGSFTGVDATAMAAAEPALAFGAAATVDTIGVTVGTGGASITFEKLVNSTRSYGVSVSDTGTVTYCKGAAAGACDTAAENLLTKW